MLIAVPLGVGVALFITQYAPAGSAGQQRPWSTCSPAVPSIVYGLWGAFVFGPHITGVQVASVLDPFLSNDTGKVNIPASSSSGSCSGS